MSVCSRNTKNISLALGEQLHTMGEQLIAIAKVLKEL